MWLEITLIRIPTAIMNTAVRLSVARLAKPRQSQAFREQLCKAVP